MTATQLQTLCQDLYRDRAALREFNPSLSERDAVFWVLYGSLVSLLDAPPEYDPEITDTTDVYHAGVVALLGCYAPPEVAWQETIAELSGQMQQSEADTQIAP